MLPWATSDLSAPSCSSSKGPKAGSALAQGPHSRGEERQGTVFNSQRETDRLLSVQQLERSGACCLHCPRASRSQSRHGHGKGNMGVHIVAPPLAEGSPLNMLLGLPGPWSLDPSSRDTHLVLHHVIMRSRVLMEIELFYKTWNYSM